MTSFTSYLNGWVCVGGGGGGGWEGGSLTSEMKKAFAPDLHDILL